jgi:hypothetical protein
MSGRNSKTGGYPGGTASTDRIFPQPWTYILADFHPFWIAVHQRGINLFETFARISDYYLAENLPVDSKIAKLVSACSLHYRFTIFAYYEEVL